MDVVVLMSAGVSCLRARLWNNGFDGLLGLVL